METNISSKDVNEVCSRSGLVNGFLHQPNKFAEHTKKNYLADIAQLIVYLLQMPIQQGKVAVDAVEKLLTDMTDITIMGFVNSLTNGNKANATIARRISSLRRFYNYLVRLGKIGKNPVTGIIKVKVEVKAPRFIDAETFNKLLAAIDTSKLIGARDYAMLLLIYYCGLKSHETVSLMISDVNFLQETISIRRKGTAGRQVPTNNATMQALQKYTELKRKAAENNSEINTEILFVNKHGKRLSDRSVRRKLDKYLKSAGLDSDITPEDLRQTCIINMIEQGLPVEEARKMFGFQAVGPLLRFVQKQTRQQSEQHEPVGATH